jgi:endonuclease-8
VHPDREGRQLDRTEFDEIWQRLSSWMSIGVKYNRIITADPESVGKTVGRLNREERLRIYKKTNCPECGSAIHQWELANRKMYACVNCQS